MQESFHQSEVTPRAPIKSTEAPQPSANEVKPQVHETLKMYLEKQIVQPAMQRGGDEHLADIENLLEAVRDDTSLQLDRLGIWAGSRGGVEAFRFVKKHPEAVQGVLTIGAPTDLRSLLDCRPDFRKVFQEAFNMKEEELDARSIASWWRSFPQNVPVLCLHGSEDKRIPVKQAEILQRISPRLVVQIVEGGNHPLFNWPERQETITRFFRRSLYNTVEQAGMNEI